MIKNSKQIGAIGEDIAIKFLINHGYSIIFRNYRKKWGEIDIIASKDNIINFFEVKSVCFTNDQYRDFHQPEENVDGWKLKKIRKMVQTFFDENDLGLEKEFGFHVVCVYLNFVTRKAKVRMIENIIL